MKIYTCQDCKTALPCFAHIPNSGGLKPSHCPVNGNRCRWNLMENPREILIASGPSGEGKQYLTFKGIASGS